MVCRGSIAALSLLVGCTGSGGPAGWVGTIDTLSDGRVVVTNPQTESWDSAGRWRIVEEIRIGSDDGDSPEVFGRIGALATDSVGRIWVFEAQDQVIKVFDRSGKFVRSVGRRGGGPGEFANAAGIEALPDGRMVVFDHQNARVSWFDSAGKFLSSVKLSGGIQVFPWPGRLDRYGFLHDIASASRGVRPGTFGLALVRYDQTMVPLDTVVMPQWQGTSNTFDLDMSGGGSIRASVPYSEGQLSRLGPDGTVWAVLTGSYELLQINREGDTARLVTKPFTPVPVTDLEKDTAIARLKWFTDQGGKVDRGRIPNTKPIVQDFIVADDGYLWIQKATADTSLNGRRFDLFDPEGRFLGEVSIPFVMSLSPRPKVTSEFLIATTQDEDGIPYVVRARIIR